MRKFLLAFVAMFFLMGSAALVATAQDDATPDASPTEAGTNPVDPAIGDTITYFGEDGGPIATVTVTGIERGWEEFDEYYDPEAGTEYVAFTVEIASTIPRGAFDVDGYQFSLQAQSGFLYGPSFVESESADPPILDSDSLAKGDSLEASLVFNVVEGEPLAHLFWQPEGALLTLAQLEGE